MCSKSEFQKCSNNNVPARLDNDRFSDLPTCLIVKILSLLPVKDVVVTSALSKNWKQLWTLVANLDFNEILMKTTSEKDFIGIVNQVILLHDNTYLQRFYLECVKLYDGSVVNAWISNIVPCNLQELDLSVPINCPALLSSDIFLCKTLVVLKINVQGKVNIPTSVSLPNLRTLQLNRVEISDDASLTSLLNGCTVLEELKMVRCIGKNVRVINIVSRTLTKLSLLCLVDDEKIRPTTPIKYRIVLDTPSLENFCIIDDVAKDYVGKKFNHLTEAYINITLPVSVWSEAAEMHTRALTGLFNMLSLAQTLKLSNHSMKAIKSFVFEVPKFDNLTKLEISTVDSLASGMLATFLENSPYLETLNLSKVVWYENHFIGLGHNDIVPSCFRSHLKLVNIKCCLMTQEAMEMIKFFLKNAQVLEKLDLRYRKYNDMEEGILQRKILKFPKASSICRIRFEYNDATSIVCNATQL